MSLAAFKNIQLKYDNQPCVAKRCMIQVGGDTASSFMGNTFVGKVRQAVEVIVNRQKFYLDNEDGTGWMKLIEKHTVQTTEVKADKVICYLE